MTSERRHIGISFLAVLLALLCCAQESTEPVPSAGDSLQVGDLPAQMTAEARRQKQVGPGDVVEVRLEEDPDVQFKGPVNSEGLISLPYLGNFHIGGMTQVAAEEALSAALREELYERATVSVVLLKRAPRFVYFYGAVANPGRLSYPDLGELSLVQALTQAGGVEKWAAPGGAYLLRRASEGEPKRRALDIAAAYERLDSEANLRLQPNDVVFIPSAGSVSVVNETQGAVQIYGAVQQPGQVGLPLQGPLSLIEAVTRAGGLLEISDAESAYVLRKEGEQGRRNKMPTDLAAAFENLDDPERNPRLEPGDVIYIPKLDPEAQEVASSTEVIVTGQVGRPGPVIFRPQEQKTVLRAIYRAGGFTQFARRSNVELVRYSPNGRATRQKIDVSAIIDDGRIDLDKDVRDGDMIIVGKRVISF